MRFLHTMIRTRNMDESLDFWVNKMGLVESRRIERPADKLTLIFLATPDQAEKEPDSLGLRIGELELNYHWDVSEDYSIGRSFGHIAYAVSNIYETCAHLQNKGVIINCPPRDGFMALIRSPEGITIELLQDHESLAPAEPWSSMPDTGQW